MQRIVGRMPSSKLAEEHVMQQAVHRLPHLLFHHHLQQDEIDATVFVLAPHAEARVLDLLDNGVFKRVVQIHVTGDLCRKARLFPGRYQIGKKREVVAHIGPGVETDRMRLVLRITVQAAFITILVDRVQIEVDSRRQAGLVVEEVFDSFKFFLSESFSSGIKSDILLFSVNFLSSYAFITASKVPAALEEEAKS